MILAVHETWLAAGADPAPTDVPDSQVRSTGSLVDTRGEGRVDNSPLADQVARARAGDQQAWRDLVDRFTRLVWSVARAHRLDHADAADVCQTTWLRLHEHLGSLRDPSRLPGWLATTARRESLRVIAGRRRETPDPMPGDTDVDPGAGPEAAVLTRDRDVRLWKTFNGLPERCRQLLRVLSSLPDLSYQQVGELLDIPVGSIGPTRGRCLDNLRRRLAASDFTGSDFGGSGVPRGSMG